MLCWILVEYVIVCYWNHLQRLMIVSFDSFLLYMSVCLICCGDFCDVHVYVVPIFLWYSVVMQGYNSFNARVCLQTTKFMMRLPSCERIKIVWFNFHSISNYCVFYWWYIPVHADVRLVIAYNINISVNI